MQLNFLVVQGSSTYNVILRRSGLNALQAIISMYHLLMCIQMRKKINEMREDQQLTRQCCLTIAKEGSRLRLFPSTTDWTKERKKIKGTHRAYHLDALLIGGPDQNYSGQISLKRRTKGGADQLSKKKCRYLHLVCLRYVGHPT